MLMIYLKNITFYRLKLIILSAFLLLIFGCHASNNDEKNTLYFYFKVSDYFSPYLTTQQNKEVLDKLLYKNKIIIIGHYTGIEDIENVTFRKVTRFKISSNSTLPIPDPRWVEEIVPITKKEYAKLFNNDNTLNLNFSLPFIKKDNFKLTSITIKLNTPQLVSDKAISVEIPVDIKSDIPPNIWENIPLNLALTPEVNINGFAGNTSDYVLAQMAVIKYAVGQTPTLDTLKNEAIKALPPATTFNEKQRNAISTAYNSINNQHNIYDISAPLTLPRWYGMHTNGSNTARAQFKTKGALEYLWLFGFLPDEKNDQHRQEEKWFMQEGKLQKITAQMIDCNFAFSITLNNGQVERRVFMTDPLNTNEQVEFLYDEQWKDTETNFLLENNKNTFHNISLPQCEQLYKRSLLLMSASDKELLSEYQQLVELVQRSPIAN